MKFIATIKQLKKIKLQDIGEPLVVLDEVYPEIVCSYRRNNTGINKIWVRKTIAEKLLRVQRRLKKTNPSLQLLVVEGLRPAEYQEYYFLEHLVRVCKKNPEADFETLLEYTHQFVALPSIAGHPTGGAVDLTILSDDHELDMGTSIANFDEPEKLPTYSPKVESNQSQNRLLLLKAMMAEGFAPFYGEWWHFSYGDREWAAFYKRKKTLYGSVNIPVWEKG